MHVIWINFFLVTTYQKAYFLFEVWDSTGLWPCSILLIGRHKRTQRLMGTLGPGNFFMVKNHVFSLLHCRKCVPCIVWLSVLPSCAEMLAGWLSIAQPVGKWCDLLILYTQQSWFRLRLKNGSLFYGFFFIMLHVLWLLSHFCSLIAEWWTWKPSTWLTNSWTIWW